MTPEERDLRNNIAAGIRPRVAVIDDRTVLILLAEIDRLRRAS